MKTPKAFISYSWTSPAFREQIRQWADRLAADGVEIILDQYDLKEGQDKYAYMEKMAADPSVTHVLMFVDKRYTEKANARDAGVGTESQIISKEVYDKTEQSKFVPVVCELDDKGQPYLPVFLGSRIFVDFSSEDAVNRNWEGLIRLLHGKPLHIKPQTGKPPAYIAEDTKLPTNPAAGKFAVFKNAYVSGHKSVRMYRRDFLDSCAAYVDELRLRTAPAKAYKGEDIVSDFRKLIPIRNLIVDWALLEAETDSAEEFGDTLIHFLERLLDLRGRPSGVGSWTEAWYEGHELFAYETFLYIVAALLKTGAVNILNAVLLEHYLTPESDSRSATHVTCTAFYSYCEHINAALLAEVGEKGNLKYHSQAIELIKRSADRSDISFEALKEADALILIATLLKKDRWYPQTHYYWQWGRTAPFFVRAIQHKHFVKLGIILGIKTGDELRSAWEATDKSVIQSIHSNVSIAEFTHLSKLDTLK